MSKPHAFQLRDFYTCSTCDYNERGHCTRNGRPIRWRADRYGCGDYAASDNLEDIETKEGRE